MSNLISKKANTGTIEEHVRYAWMKALAHGGWLLVMAKEFLAQAVSDVDTAVAAMRAAVQAEEAAAAAVEVQEEKCRIYICSIKDDLYSLLGRTNHNRYMAQVFPGGVDTYTVGPAKEKPVLISLLQRNIAMCTASDVTDELRQTWITGLAAVRQGLVDALVAHEPTVGAARVEQAAYVQSVQLAREQLRLFKRALENRGQSKAQVSDIIPDATPSGPKTPKTPETPTPPSGGSDSTTKAG